MKKTTTLKFALLAVVGMIGMVSGARAQTDMGSDGTIANIQSLINSAESRGREVVRVEADIISTEKTTLRELQEGYTYTIVGEGCDKIADLDVYVYKYVNDSWELITKDADESNVALVSIAPESTGTYKIKVVAYKFKEGYTVGHYALVVSHNQ